MTSKDMQKIIALSELSIILDESSRAKNKARARLVFISVMSSLTILKKILLVFVKKIIPKDEERSLKYEKNN